MDLGSGTVVLSSGIVSGRPRRADVGGEIRDRDRPRSRWMGNGGTITVLVVLGTARAIAVMGVGYAVHVSE